MKTLNLKMIRFSLLLLGGILGMVMIVKAFQNHSPEGKIKVNQVWYYLGDASDSRTDSTQYSLTADPLRQCSSIIKEDICKIEAPAGSGPYPDLSAMATASKTARQQITDALADPNSPQTNETVKEFRPES